MFLEYKQWGTTTSETSSVNYPITFTLFAVPVMTHTTNVENDFKNFNILNANLIRFIPNIYTRGTSAWIAIGV